MNIPGTAIDVCRDRGDIRCPGEVLAIFEPQLPPALPGRLAAVAGRPEGVVGPALDRPGGVTAGMVEPLLDMAPTLRQQVGANVLRAATSTSWSTSGRPGSVHAGEECRFRFDIAREARRNGGGGACRRLEQLAVPVLPLHRGRDGDFNEYVYNFFKSLSRSA